MVVRKIANLSNFEEMFLVKVDRNRVTSLKENIVTFALTRPELEEMRNDIEAELRKGV